VNSSLNESEGRFSRRKLLPFGVMFVLMAGLFFIVESADAQRRQRRVGDVSADAPGMIIKGHQAQTSSVAIAELDVSGTQGSDLKVQYAKTMKYDLEFSDYFDVLPNGAGMVNQHRKDSELRAIDYGAWQNLDADILVKGEFTKQGKSGGIRLYAYDVFDQKSLNALEYKVQFDSPEKMVREIRRAIHNFVDGLVAKYDPDGIPGCAHSYVAFENLRTSSGSSIREIFIMDYDGRNIRQITRDHELAVAPAWSPDGRKLVYTSYRQGNPDLYIYNLDSGKIRVLAAFPGMNGAASWSPDGRSLAVTLSRDGNPEIYRIGSDGSGAKRLTKSRSVETSPTWTPDGRNLFFISDRYGGPNIYTMSAEGGPHNLVVRSGQNDDPSISPRGDRIAYTSSRGGGGFNIWAAGLDGGSPANLTSELRGNSEHPSWAPDGRHIVFANEGKVMVMDGNGSDKRILTSSDRIPGKNFSPAWGP